MIYEGDSKGSLNIKNPADPAKVLSQLFTISTLAASGFQVAWVLVEKVRTLLQIHSDTKEGQNM